MQSCLNILVVNGSKKDASQWIDLLDASADEISYRSVASSEEIRNALQEQDWDLVVSEQNDHELVDLPVLQAFRDLAINTPLILLTEADGESINSITPPAQVYELISKKPRESLTISMKRVIRDAQRRREQRRMEKVQAALINLSNAALTARSLDELYNTIHTTIDELMPAKNFYICLYDAPNDVLWFPYFVDEFDEIPPPQKLDQGLTAWVIRNGKPLLALPDVFEDLIKSGEVEAIGAPSIDWLGVPLLIDGKVIGALAVQSYTEGVRFTQPDLEILQFVSTQVAMAIDRKRAEEALKSESQLRKAIEDSILAGIIAVDAEGRQTYVNPAFCRMVGWSERDLLGATPPYRYWPPEDLYAITEAFRVTTGEDALPSDFELVFRRRNEERFDALLLVSPLRDSEGRPHGWLASVYDITARKRDEETIRRQKARAEALARTASRLNTRLDLQKVLNTVCEETARALNVPAACVFLYDPGRDWFDLKAGYGLPDRLYHSFQPIPRRMIEKVFGRLDHAVTIQDIKTIPEFANADLFSELNVCTSVMTSLARDRSPVGSLAVFTFEDARSFTPDEQALLEGLGDLAAQAIVNARLFEDLEKSLQQVRALNAVDVAINASLDLRVTLNILLDQVINLLNVDAADVWLYNPVTQELEYTAGRGFRLLQPKVNRMRLGDQYASRIVIERKSINIQDLASIPEGYDSVNRLANEGLNAYVGIPLIAKGQVKGVLEIFRRAEFDQNSEWTELLDALSGQAAIAIDNATLFDQLQRSNEELTHALDTTLEGWVSMLDRRNFEPEGYSQRLIDLTIQLARHMGVREEDLVHTRRGVLLHDIGMLRVPDSILAKTGPLTAEEREIVKQHPLYAYQIMAPNAFLRPSLEIPYCHHERWDGSGYPRGLHGAQIPLAARIFSAADVWEVLHSNRPYRPAMHEGEVRKYLADQAGTEFDPEVVSLFLDIV
jgi:PAS domain S-box-containing protein